MNIILKFGYSIKYEFLRVQNFTAYYLLYYQVWYQRNIGWKREDIASLLSSLFMLSIFSSFPFLLIIFLPRTPLPGPDGVKRFLLGRQLIVVPLGFLVAQITHFDRYPAYNFSPALYFFTISLGLPGKVQLWEYFSLMKNFFYFYWKTLS